MAKADYYLCDICDRKVFYDADVDYDWNTGEMAVLCNSCSKDFRVLVVERAAHPKEYRLCDKAIKRQRECAEADKARFMAAVEESRRLRDAAKKNTD